MRLLITGAAGNLGSRLARSLLDSRHELRLMVHRRPLPFDVGPFPRVSITRADLGDAASLSVFGTASPLTRDFVRIGMASSVADTSRMKRELLPRLQYPTLKEGLYLL